MKDSFPDYDGKVKFFSNTMGTGVKGLSRRVKGWMSRNPSDLLNIAYRKGRKALAPKSMPFAQAIHVEVTNACNLKCVMCPRLEMTRPVGFMPRQTFETIVSQIAPYRRMLEGVALMGLGEPLLVDELEAFSRIAKRAKLPNVYTSTNAALLDEKRSQKMLEEGRFDRVIFSLDGATEKTFTKIRVGADFASVYKNVEEFLRMKVNYKNAPTVSLQILVMEETIKELRDFCDYWVPKLSDSDDILIKEVDTFGGLVDDRRMDADREPENRFACRQLWRDMSIAWDGQVTVCCKDVFYMLAVGNIHETSLPKLWTSKKWEAIRNAHIKGVYSMEPCDQCREWYV